MTSNNSELKLYKVFRIDDTWGVYDIYDSFVVVAADENDAKLVHPNLKDAIYDKNKKQWVWINKTITSWPNLEKLKVECIGIADPNLQKGQVILSSYNRG